MRAGLDSIVLTDHDGLYGAIRFSEAARELGIRAGYGVELSLGLTEPQTGVADPARDALAGDRTRARGDRRLRWAISHAQLAGEKGAPRYDVYEVVEKLRGHAQILTGCRKGAVGRALVEWGAAAAAELIDHGLPVDCEHNDALAAMAAELDLQGRVTTVHFFEGNLIPGLRCTRRFSGTSRIDTTPARCTPVWAIKSYYLVTDTTTGHQVA